MTPSEELEEMLLEAFDYGVATGAALQASHSDLSMSEIRARARNKFETMKEEMSNG